MLTRRQHDVLNFIQGYVQQYDMAPSLAEIAQGIGIRSRGAAHRLVQALAEHGRVRLLPGRKRGVVLVDDTDAGPGGAAPAWELPLLGRIAAGRPIEAIPGRDALNIAEFLLGPDRFALRVQGDSMCEAGILDGDTVIVQRSDTARDGDIVVALIDGDEATLKRFQGRDDGAVTLVPANAEMTPCTYPAQRVAVQGVVVAQLRSYR